MPAYHSACVVDSKVQRIGNVALLPVKSSVRSPVPSLPKDSKGIIFFLAVFSPSLFPSLLGWYFLKEKPV